MECKEIHNMNMVSMVVNLRRNQSDYFLNIYMDYSKFVQYPENDIVQI